MSSTFGEIISSPRDVVDDYECVAYSEPICPPTAQRFTATAPFSPATSPWHTRVAVPSRAWYSWSCSPNLELPSTRWSRDRHNFAYPRSPDNDMGSLCPCLPTRYPQSTVDPIPQSDHLPMHILGITVSFWTKLLRASLSKFGEQWQCRDR